MLLEFKVANFRSIKEEQTLSLIASKDDTHHENLIDANGLILVKAAAIYGANASGKSNLVKAMECMKVFVEESATKLNQGDPIPGIVPFRLDSKLSDQPSVFELNFVFTQIRYVYGFSATAERVHDEWLIAYYPKGSGRTWIDRKFDPATSKTVWKFGKEIDRGVRDTLKQRTRDNCLVLSRGAELNIQVLNILFVWIKKCLRIEDLSNDPQLLIRETALLIQDYPALAGQINQLIQHADFGISQVVVDKLDQEKEKKQIEKLRKSPHYNSSWFIRSMFPQIGFEKSISIHTTRSLPGSAQQVEFEMEEDESNGTQRFFGLAGPFLKALAYGTVLVLDEFDCSMHPLMTRKLVELFQSPEMNRKGAQLIFSTQDSTLMDPVLFRRDQIWLVEKNQHGASELYSLYDFETAKRPRNNSAFERQYLSGRFGAVPRFGPTFEDLKLKTVKDE